jgi:hypothetical protein
MNNSVDNEQTHPSSLSRASSMREAQDLSQQVASRLAPLCARVWPERFVRLYGHHLAQSIQNMPGLPGLPGVDLSLGYAPAVLCPPEAPSELRSIQDVLSHSRHLIISGSLGVGKTALLRALAWEYASRLDPASGDQPISRLSAQAQEGSLPILIDLASFARESKPPFDLLFDSMATCGLPATRSFLREYLQQGKCILLCDNLHTVSDPARRAELAEMVERFGGNVWVMAQRPTTWSIDLPAFQRVTLRGIDPHALATFLDRLAGERAGDLPALHAAFERNATLRELAHIPLMAIVILRQVLATPGRTIHLPDLYEACLTTCLSEWDVATRHETEFPITEHVAALRAIAYRMQQTQASAIDGDVIHRLIEQELHLTAGNEAERWFESLTSERGILCPVAEGSTDYRFFAPGMQNYLAGMARHPSPADEHAARPYAFSPANRQPAGQRAG